MVGAAGHPHVGSDGIAVEWILSAPFVLAAVVYVTAAVADRRRGRVWPVRRIVCWLLGLTAAAAAFVGPLAVASHESFTGHMAAHLLAGMVAPLLLALAAPMTLALRTLSVVPARRVTRLLRGRIARTLTQPVVAATLNVGGLWVLYTTPLFELMQRDILVHLVVMVHVLVVGYLYTVSLIAVDPAPHRAGLVLRATVLVLSLAAHGVLAKMLYAYPPAGVTVADAHAGAQLMFYGGDAVDVVLVALVCAEWYRVTGRRLKNAPAAVSP